MRDNLEILPPGLGDKDIGDERGGNVENGYQIFNMAIWGMPFTEPGNRFFFQLAGEGHSEWLQREDPIDESESGDG